MNRLKFLKALLAGVVGAFTTAWAFDKQLAQMPKPKPLVCENCKCKGKLKLGIGVDVANDFKTTTYYTFCQNCSMIYVREQTRERVPVKETWLEIHSLQVTDGNGRGITDAKSTL